MTSPAPEPPRDTGALAFAEKVLTLLDEGRFTATYKYAVMLALMDLCLERSTRDGFAPSAVTTRQLADKVLELYWPHSVPYHPAYDAAAGRVLLQNRPSANRSGGQAAIVSAIRRFREQHASDPSAPLGRARRQEPRRFEALARFDARLERFLFGEELLVNRRCRDVPAVADLRTKFPLTSGTHPPELARCSRGAGEPRTKARRKPSVLTMGRVPARGMRHPREVGFGEVRQRGSHEHGTSVTSS